MADKNIPKVHVPKGQAYCDKAYTYCFYNHLDICVNCGRKKGWRRRDGKNVR